ncbi:MAG: hypothetical protein GXP41_11425 [Chloroflexi bacterium]|nr:hypothetical protein [Chloroflexota bacterium]
MKHLNKYEQAIVRNADWFISNQTHEGFINVAGDEFYGVKGDATLVGHSVTIRMYAYALTNEQKYSDSALTSLQWLAERQDENGGWKNHAAFTLDAAQCVFEGFNTFQAISGDDRFKETLNRAARHMITGTVDQDGNLLLPNIIEIGEYAHFSLLAWKTMGDEYFKQSAERILSHIYRNFDENQGYWYPFDSQSIRSDLPARLIRPALRWTTNHFQLKGRIVARMADHILPIVVGETHPQYAMNMMDAESLLDTLDGSCDFPELRTQTEAAIRWVKKHCNGPYPGSLVESKVMTTGKNTYPIRIINDTEMAALWPSACLLLAYCGMNDSQYREEAKRTADWIVSVQDEKGGFYNFQKPDGTTLPLQSGNVNFYASMALWLYSEVYEESPVKLFTRQV